MRSKSIAVALFSSAVLLGGAGAARAEGEVSAKVNGMAISQARLDGTFGAFLEAQRVSASALRHPKDYQDLRRKILDTLVAQELLAQEAQKRGYKAPEDEVKKAVEQAQGQLPSKEVYLQRLENVGFTEASYAEDARQRLAVAQMVEKDITAKIQVTDQEIQEYYSANPAAFTPPEQVQVRHILITVAADADAGTRDAAKKKAEGILAEIKGGADFAELAKKHSQDTSAQGGGDLGLVGRGQTVKPFEDVAFTLKPGEVSEVVVTDFGYHIIKVEARQGGQAVALDTVRDQVRQFLVNRKTQEQLQALVESLRKSAQVQVLE